MNAYQTNLIESNTKFAYYMANEWSKKQSTLPLEELQSLCLLSLTKAALKYDPKKNNNFLNYVKIICNNHIIMELKKANTYFKHTSLNIPEFSSQKFEEAPIDLMNLLNRLSPTQKEVCSYIMQGYTQQEVATILKCSKTKINKIFQDVRFYIKNNIAEQNSQ